MVSEFNSNEDQSSPPPTYDSSPGRTSATTGSEVDEKAVAVAVEADGGGGAHHGLASLKAQPGSHHHFSDAEPVQLSTFINARFAGEPLLANLLPIDGTEADNFFDAWGDGMLLSVLVNAACEGAVNLAPLRRRAQKPLGVSVRHLTIQHFAVLNDALEGCKSIDGLRLGFVGAEDFVQGNRPVILGVGWQLVRLAILQRANILDRPELAVLFTAEETAKGMGKPGQEELLLSRWFNHYLQASGSDRQVWSFGAELADCVAYCSLLNAIDSSACPPPDESDADTNASNVATAVQKMGIKGVFVTEHALLEGDRKMNVMFCAQILDAHPRLITVKEKKTRNMRESISSMFRGGQASESVMDSPTTTGTTSSGKSVPSSSAPPPAPPSDFGKRSLDYGREYGRDDYGDEDDSVQEAGGCGLFSCVTRS